MNINEKRKAFENLLFGAPEVMTPMQVAKWTPYGRNTVYAMLKSGELPSIQYRGSYLISKSDLIDYMVAHADDTPRKRFAIKGDK
ncbi:MAG: helix-turn-helix domain-containing protein [Clostridia bacterium]|nr:helix-turn-helix domain-containing protein [Clostridia bacterium]